MGISAASNIASLSAQRVLNNTTNQLSKTFERLSSGLRINSPSDDPAGLALADSLRADSRIASVAIRNANDGLSIAAIADGALEEISNLLTRMAELAGQSANGAYTNTQRSALSLEFISLGSEINRIAETTTFNDISLISSSSSITLQVGLNSSSNSRISITAVQSSLYGIGLSTTTANTLSYSIISTTTAYSESAAQNALTAVTTALNNVSVLRGNFGAAESRLSTAISYLTVARENFVAAESRIRDADIAAEVADMVRLQVLQQAGTAVLAQANLQPQLVLSLLGV